MPQPSSSTVVPPLTRSGTRRRRIVAAVLTPLVVAGILVAVGTAGAVWTLAATGVAVLVAATAATYVPDAGRPWSSRLGCTPCAGVAGGASLVALLVLAAVPGDLGQAMLALAFAGAGLMQRVRGAGESCPTGAPRA